MSPVMVGRAHELDRISRLVSEQTSDRPVVALVGGEAGVGKTRLVRELLARVPVGLPVLAGQADPGALGRPFELLLDALDGKGDPANLAIVADRTRPLDERVTAGLELVREVICCAEQRGLIVLEDLHWADSESLILFERLAEPDVGSLVLIGTYRPEGVHRRHPLSEALPRLERRHSVTHVRLSRLTTADVAEFLTAVYLHTPAFRVVEALHARTSGNPFFLEELLAAAGAEDGDVDPNRLVDQPLPWSLAEAVRAQLDSLDADERCIVEAAAVLGRRVGFDLLATVTGTGESDLIDILRRIVARGLLVEDEHDLFSFRHALAREAIEQELLGRERRRLHQLALDALKEAGSTDHAGIAHHALGAGRDDEVVAAARAGAKDYLVQGSTYQALQLAELGLRVAEDDAKLLAVAARAAWLAGLGDDALGHNTHRLDIVRRMADDEELSAALRLQVRLTWEVSDERATDEVVAELSALVDRMPPSRERGAALAQIAQLYMFRDRVDDAVSWSDRALIEADELDDDLVRAAAMVEKGSMLVMLPDRADEGSALLVEAAELAERVGEDIVVARALFNLVGMDIRPRDLEGTKALLERMRAAAERVGFDSLSGAGYAQALADLAEWRGDYDGAVCALEEGRRLDRGYLRTTKGSWYANYEAGLALEAGDVDRAAALCDSMEPLPGSTRARWHAGLAMHVAARRGDLPAARAALETLVEDQRSTASALYQVQMVHDVVSAALPAGLVPAELAPLVERIRQAVLPDQQSVIEEHPGRRLVMSQLAEFEGRHEAALEGYVAAGAAVEQLFPYVRATAHVGAARCLIALGREPEAKEHVAEAEQLLSRWKGWRVDELEAVRRRLGLGGDVPGPAALTKREREVVALLAEGLSNAELAGRLFISPKTAAVHVSNVLAKLGMASRTEVAAWAIRDGIG